MLTIKRLVFLLQPGQKSEVKEFKNLFTTGSIIMREEILINRYKNLVVILFDRKNRSFLPKKTTTRFNRSQYFSLATYILICHQYNNSKIKCHLSCL